MKKRKNLKTKEILMIQKEESEDERDSKDSKRRIRRKKFRKKNQTTKEIQKVLKKKKGDVTRIPKPTRKHIFLLMYH